MLKKIIFACGLAAGAASAQEWEIGAIGGYGFAPDLTVKGPAGTANTGFNNGFAIGVYGGNDTYQYWSGEARYLYRQSDLKLSSGGTSVNFGGSSQLVTADFLVHFRPRESKIRPFILFGGGWHGSRIRQPAAGAIRRAHPHVGDARGRRGRRGGEVLLEPVCRAALRSARLHQSGALEGDRRVPRSLDQRDCERHRRDGIGQLPLVTWPSSSASTPAHRSSCHPARSRLQDRPAASGARSLEPERSSQSDNTTSS